MRRETLATLWLMLVCIGLSLAAVACTPGPAPAGHVSSEKLSGAQELLLKADQPYRRVSDFVSYFEESGRTLRIGDAIAVDRAGRFQRFSTTRTIDFGFTDARIWLKLNVRNGANTPRPSVLALNINYMDEIDVWLVTRGGARNILHQTEESPFASRPVNAPHLAAPFTLGPGEAGEIYIAYWSTGGTSAPIAIETPTTFAERRAEQGAWRIASYAVLGLLVVFSLLLSGTLRSRLFLLYASYVACALLFVMHGDGETFHYLWPNWPQWSVYVSVPLGYGLIIAAGLFSREFLGTEKAAPRLDKVIQYIIGAAIIGIVAGLVGFAREARMAGFSLLVISSTVFLFGGLRALSARMPGALYYVVAWSSIFASAVFAFLAVTTPAAPSLVIFELVRGGILVDALMMALALVVQVIKIRAERDDLVRRELAAMRANMGLIERINALEQRHALVAAAAEASGRTLASAFHDMRPPLLSLRLAVQRLALEPAAARDAQQLEASVAYLEKLAETLLATGAGRASAGRATSSAQDKMPVGDPVQKADELGEAEETFKAQLVLDALEQMFARDAREKGLRFTCVKSSATLAAPPLVLVRVLSNLVANAVKHVNTGGVVVGCRRKAGRIWLCVLDTGPGLPSTQPGGDAQSDVAAQRPETGRGSGLGLSIVRRLAAEHGLIVEQRSTPGKGSTFAIGVVPAV